MSARAPWKELGIAPTSDVRVIRSAYAAKLKLIDVDHDPESFHALRSLHDRALQLAHNIRAKEGGQMTVADHEFAKYDRDAAPGDLPAPTADEPDAFAELNDLRQQIWDMLVTSGANPWSANSLAVATQRLLALPVLDQIDVADDTERWLAAIVAENIPRSDPMIDMLIGHYGWHKLVGSINDFYGLAVVLQRQSDMECSARLRNPSHRWHQAFSYLQGEAADAFDDAEKRRIGNHIALLLDSIRFHNPTVEAELNPRHVEAWDKLIADAKLTKAMKQDPLLAALPDLTPAQWIGFAIFLFGVFNLIASKLL
jgi:hypothetical protein